MPIKPKQAMGGAAFRQGVKQAGQARLKEAYRGGTEYSELPGGTTYNARGQKEQLTRQGLVTRQVTEEWRKWSNADGMHNPGMKEPQKYRYSVEYDKGWDDYNKAMREMRHRVSSGVRGRRAAEKQAKTSKFGAPGASGSRTATLIARAFDDEEKY